MADMKKELAKTWPKRLAGAARIEDADADPGIAAVDGTSIGPALAPTRPQTAVPSTAKGSGEDPSDDYQMIRCGSKGWSPFLRAVRGYCASGRRSSRETCQVVAAFETCDAARFEVGNLVLDPALPVGESFSYAVKARADGEGGKVWNLAFTRNDTGWQVAAITYGPGK
jgi:hypothetical protein